MYDYNVDWKTYNQLLENRGKIITLLIQPSLIDNDGELKIMNKGKRGKPFRYPRSLILAAFAIKCALRFGYRQTRGLIKDVSAFLKFNVPNFRSIWWRIDKMKDFGIKFNVDTKSKHIIAAIDSTGLKLVNDGEYRTMRYDKRKEWIKMHVLVDKETGQVINMKITKGNIFDNNEFEELTNPFLTLLTAIFADKAYDERKNFETCEKNNIIAGIPVKLNSNPSINRNIARKKAIEEQLGLDIRRGSYRRNLYQDREKRKLAQDEWKKKVSYGNRQIVESFNSRFKRTVGENVLSKKWKNREKEVTAKINLMNLFATIQI
jgi:hypothetical protein